MKFNYESANGTKVEFTVADDATLDEVLEELQLFLRACGYTIDYDKVLDIVSMDE